MSYCYCDEKNFTKMCKVCESRCKCGFVENDYYICEAHRNFNLCQEMLQKPVSNVVNVQLDDGCRECIRVNGVCGDCQLKFMNEPNEQNYFLSEEILYTFLDQSNISNHKNQCWMSQFLLIMSMLFRLNMCIVDVNIDVINSPFETSIDTIEKAITKKFNIEPRFKSSAKILSYVYFGEMVFEATKRGLTYKDCVYDELFELFKQIDPNISSGNYSDTATFISSIFTNALYTRFDLGQFAEILNVPEPNRQPIDFCNQIVNMTKKVVVFTISNSHNCLPALNIGNYSLVYNEILESESHFVGYKILNKTECIRFNSFVKKPLTKIPSDMSVGKPHVLIYIRRN